MPDGLFISGADRFLFLLNRYIFASIQPTDMLDIYNFAQELFLQRYVFEIDLRGAGLILFIITR